MWEEKETYIKPEDMQERKVYKVWARNFDIGVWDGKASILGIRHKFNARFIDSETHWDLDSTFGTCKPEKVLCDVPPDIEVSVSSKELFAFLKENGENMRQDKINNDKT